MAVIDSLVSFPFFSSANVSGLKAEFPLYAAAAEDIDPSYDPLLFGKGMKVTYQIGVGLLDRCFLYSRLQQPPSMYSLYLRTPSETDRMQHFKTI